MRGVYSSNVRMVGHDPDTNEMVVDWMNGKRSIYSGVSYEKFLSVANSWSVGGEIHQQIKGHHAHRYG